MEQELDKLTARFQDYVSYETQSKDERTSCPSTPGQKVLAKHLFEQLKELGLTDVTLDDNGYVMGTLPANGCEDAPVVGFIAHMDTSPDASGANIKTRIVKNYDGKDILLNEKLGIYLKPADFSELLNYKGQDIMVTDGTTLLGADDKAGITAIMGALEYLHDHPEVQHGKLRIGFTPDEEIGMSADLFDVKKFGADFAYTIDGGAIGGIEYENFNAANAVIEFHGRSVHTGDAKNKMKNALSMANEWYNMLPEGERPEYTAGYEGFYQVHQLSGDVANAKMKMLIRDHDKEKFAARKAYLQRMADFLNARYGEGSVVLKCEDSYFNMREKIEPVMHIVEIAKKAMRDIGVEPVCEPIRGGTDGARLSFEGLPCPNIFTGGHNFHGNFEYLPLQSLQKSCGTVLGIIKGVSELKK